MAAGRPTGQQSVEERLNSLFTHQRFCLDDVDLVQLDEYEKDTKKHDKIVAVLKGRIRDGLKHDDAQLKQEKEHSDDGSEASSQSWEISVGEKKDENTFEANLSALDKLIEALPGCLPLNLGLFSKDTSTTKNCYCPHSSQMKRWRDQTAGLPSFECTKSTEMALGSLKQHLKSEVQLMGCHPCHKAVSMYLKLVAEAAKSTEKDIAVKPAATVPGAAAASLVHVENPDTLETSTAPGVETEAEIARKTTAWCIEHQKNVLDLKNLTGVGMDEWKIRNEICICWNNRLRCPKELALSSPGFFALQLAYRHAATTPVLSGRKDVPAVVPDPSIWFLPSDAQVCAGIESVLGEIVDIEKGAHKTATELIVDIEKGAHRTATELIRMQPPVPSPHPLLGDNPTCGDCAAELFNSYIQHISCSCKPACEALLCLECFIELKGKPKGLCNQKYELNARRFSLAELEELHCRVKDRARWVHVPSPLDLSSSEAPVVVSAIRLSGPVWHALPAPMQALVTAVLECLQSMPGFLKGLSRLDTAGVLRTKEERETLSAKRKRDHSEVAADSAVDIVASLMQTLRCDESTGEPDSPLTRIAKAHGGSFTNFFMKVLACLQEVEQSGRGHPVEMLTMVDCLFGHRPWQVWKCPHLSDETRLALVLSHDPMLVSASTADNLVESIAQRSSVDHGGVACNCGKDKDKQHQSPVSSWKEWYHLPKILVLVLKEGMNLAQIPPSLELEEGRHDGAKVKVLYELKAVIDGASLSTAHFWCASKACYRVSQAMQRRPAVEEHKVVNHCVIWYCKKEAGLPVDDRKN